MKESERISANLDRWLAIKEFCCATMKLNIYMNTPLSKEKRCPWCNSVKPDAPTKGDE
jgi:hypothetical protein